MLYSRSVVALALSLALILIGINSQAGWLFWLASMIVAAVVVSWLLSLQQVRGLSLTRRHAPKVVEGEALEVTLEVSNKGRFSRHLLEVMDEDPCADRYEKRPRLRAPRKALREYMRDPSPPRVPSPDEDGGRAAFLLPLVEGRGKAVLAYRRAGLRRGVYRDWPGAFYSEGLLGLARRSRRVAVMSSLVVYPFSVELGSFPLADSFLHPQRSPYDLSSKGSGMDFYAVREFRSGDPLRHVHWKTTARRGELVVREFEREVGTPLVVLVDNYAGNGEGNGAASSLDSAARLAASIVRYAHHAGHPTRLVAYDGERPAVYDVPHFEAALEWLASLRPQGGLSLADQVDGVRGELVSGSFLCCIAPAARFDYGRLAACLPPMCRVALVLIDQPSHNGNGGGGDPTREILSDLARAPFPGLFSISLYRKGDDLRECLERPLIIFGDYQSRER